ncbi:A24 family peptidase [Lichenihabitans sp. Uapishka_5]|uniref:A24 family peptidase n=1 Tax=Lichenihabitans sp. Uapishka_5 TaxID=3037302 RepID=UPI0029E7DFEA|nr:A24 family peptidase [Lichenihabitans sp. Uapishka_5]MDX7950963.1 A24 family peptidase [Lichenihabitans sp. Uapishka_5]
MTSDWLLDLLAPPWPQHGFGWIDSATLLGLLVACAILAIVDARFRIIPDECNGAVAALGFVAAVQDGRMAVAAAALQGGLAVLVFFLLRAAYRALRGRHGLGLGDVKFLGAAAVWVGLGGLPPLVLVACGAALAYLGLEHLRGRPVSARRAVPFGPFLVLGFMAALGLARL